jgi:hypothetical protein
MALSPLESTVIFWQKEKVKNVHSIRPNILWEKFGKIIFRANSNMQYLKKKNLVAEKHICVY